MPEEANLPKTKALAVLMADLWDACEKEYQRRYEKTINIEIVRSWFERADAHVISDKISQERKSRQPGPKSEEKCIHCDELLTVKEKDYCDKYDKKYVCYKCTQKRKEKKD